MTFNPNFNGTNKLHGTGTRLQHTIKRVAKMRTTHLFTYSVLSSNHGDTRNWIKNSFVPRKNIFLIIFV